MYQDRQRKYLCLASSNSWARISLACPLQGSPEQQTIVSNESSDIIRLFNAAFYGIGANQINFYPEHLQVEIDKLHERIYNSLNNGGYKARFATSQRAYEDPVLPLFEELDGIDDRLSNRRYLTGNTITEAD